MQSIFKVKKFQFPYLDYKFPGQGSDEVILFLTRENKIMLKLRQTTVLIAALLILSSALFINPILSQFLSHQLVFLLMIVMFLLALLFGFIGWWWVTVLWRKSIVIITNQRLMKFVYSTPASRYSLSLPLEMIVDTGAYTKGFIQTLLNLGTFTARSSASSSGVATDSPDRINKKYFYIENVAFCEDLQQYINKLLNAFRKHRDNLENFRPFIANLKGEKRQAYISENYPHYWT